MQIESYIYINKDRDKTYEVVKNIDKYFHFMLNIEDVKLLEKKPDYRLSEWKININQTPISWQQEDYFNDQGRQVTFKSSRGDLGNFQGSWQVQQEQDNKSKISFSIKLDGKGILNLRYSEDFIYRKATAIVKSMLRAFKQRLDYGIEVVKGDIIISEPINYKNREGKNIVGFFDHLRVWSKDMPFIILPPGYGETKRDTLSTSYYLVKNGFNCIRYDATDHIGESDGEMENASMDMAKLDLISTLDFIEDKFGVSRLGVVATSLSKRVAIKVASEDKRIKLLIGVVGVVNVRTTLEAVYKEDIIGNLLKGKKEKNYDILGFKVKNTYPVSAIKGSYFDLATTLEDVKNIDIPMIFLVAENDAWVKLDEVKIVFETARSPHKELHLIPSAMHQLHENPKAARVALKQIVISCTKHLLGKITNIDAVIEPSIREIAIQNRYEKERLRLREVFTVDSEREFWKEYLTSFSIIYKVPDYREYLTLLFELLDRLKEGDYILDAGCGVGYFGAWIINEILRENLSLKNSPKLYSQSRYYGIDFVHNALMVAKKQHAQLKMMLLKEHKSEKDLNNFLPAEYQECDLNFDLPFEDNYFNKICCSLVLSYLTEPLLATKELLRVLKPGGKIVVSSLKPFADLSELYRHFISVAESEHDILEARRLLSEAGKIKQKEGMGRYHFFNEREIKFLLIAAGAKKVKVFRSLGNQANVVVATKE